MKKLSLLVLVLFAASLTATATPAPTPLTKSHTLQDGDPYPICAPGVACPGSPAFN